MKILSLYDRMKCVTEQASIILRLSLSWMKANMVELCKSNMWSVEIFCETKEFVVLSDLKSFYAHKFFNSNF